MNSHNTSYILFLILFPFIYLHPLLIPSLVGVLMFLHLGENFHICAALSWIVSLPVVINSL